MADVGISVQLQGIDQVNQGLANLSGAVRKVGADAQATTAQAAGLGVTFQNIKSIVASLGLVRIFDEAKNYIDKALYSMENIGRTSKALGVSAQDLQLWHLAAERMGSSSESVDASLKFLNRTLGDMTIGIMTPAVKMLEQLGVNMKKVKDGSLSTGDAFKIAIENLGRIPDSATRTAVALQVFGRGAEELLRAINNPQLFDEIVKHFQDMGLGIAKAGTDYLGDPHSAFKDFAVFLQDFADKTIAGAIMAIDDLGAAVKRSNIQSLFTQDAMSMFGQGPTKPKPGLLDMGAFTSAGISMSQKAPLNVDLGKADAQAKKYADTIADLNAKIDETTKAIDEGNYAMLIDQELKRAGIPLTGKLTASQEEEKKTIEDLTHKYADTKEAIKEMAVASAEWNKESQQAQRLVDQLRTTEEKHADELARLNKLYDEGHLSMENYTRGVKDLERQMAEADPIAKGFGDAIANSIEGAILHGGKLSNIFKDLGKTLAQTLVHELITKNISQAITSAIHGLGGGGNLFESLGKILSGDSPFLSGLKNILQSAWNALPGILNDAWSILKSILGGIGGGGGSGIGNAIGSVLGTIGSFLGFAGGGDLTVTRPQLVMVGERGPERLSVRPMAGGHHGDNGYGGGIHIHLPPSSVLSNITAPTYARMVARAVARENRRRV